MSLHDRPTVGELLRAVRAYLSDEVATTPDRRSRFRALIAANVLGIVERELANAADDARFEDELLRGLGYASGDAGQRRRELSAEIRNGAYDAPARFAAALMYARAVVERKLAVSNPRYLERVQRSANIE